MHLFLAGLFVLGVLVLALVVAATVLVVGADATRSRHFAGRPTTAWGRLLVRLDNAALDAAWMLRTRSLDRRPAPVPPIWTGAAA